MDKTSYPLKTQWQHLAHRHIFSPHRNIDRIAFLMFSIFLCDLCSYVVRKNLCVATAFWGDTSFPGFDGTQIFTDWAEFCGFCFWKSSPGWFFVWAREFLFNRTRIFPDFCRSSVKIAAFPQLHLWARSILVILAIPRILVQTFF